MFKELYEYEDGQLKNKKTGHVYRKYNKEGYLVVSLAGREYRAHRIIWSLFFGEIPEGLVVDHIDGDRRNNKIDNLRICTKQQNCANSLSNKGKELPKGITVNPSGKYRVRISHKGTTYSIGTYKELIDAVNAYNTKALELNGEFAKLISVPEGMS